MNVLLLSNLFPTPREPARGVFVGQLAEALRRHSDVAALVPLPWVPAGRRWSSLLPEHARPFQGLPARGEFGGVEAEYLRYPMLPGLGRRWQAAAMTAVTRGPAARRHRRQPIDVLNAHWLDPDGLVGVALAKWLGVPVVLSARGCDVNLNLRLAGVRDRVLRALHAADAITTVSTQLRDELVVAGIPAERITAIPNGVDVTRFRPSDRRGARDALQLPSDVPRIVAVSRLSEEKGVDVLIAAMATEPIRRSGAVLSLVGDGPLRDSLVAQAAALGLADRIRFEGAAPHDRIPTWFAAADVCCLPSRREGYPNVVLEALACGRPMVASRVGAIPDMLAEATGMVVESGDSEALGAALAHALTRPWDASAISGTVADMSWDRAARAYHDVYTRAIAHRRTR